MLSRRIKSLFWFSVFIFCIAGIDAFAACGSGRCIQANFDGNASGPDTTLDVAYMSSQTAGHLNIVSLRFCEEATCGLGDTSGCTISVTDDQSNSYSLGVNNVINVGHRTATYYAANIASGSNTVHVSIGVCTNTFYLWVGISEWSGAATTSPLDQTGTANSGASANPSVSTTGSTADANELVYAFASNLGIAMTADFTGINNDTGTVGDQYKTVSSTGTQTLTWTAASGAWSANIVTFKDASGAAVVPRLTLLGVGP